MGEELRCPECGAAMVLKASNLHRYLNGQARLYYRCWHWPVCRGSHSAHPDGSPVGQPADRRTQLYRTLAHQVLDGWCQLRGLGKTLGYRRVQQLMGLPAAQAHIGRLDEKQCRRLIARLWGSRD
jgi:hypothetical protein